MKYSALVSYALKEESAVSLTIYDLFGKKMSSTFVDKSALGAHRLAIYMDEVPYGVYFVRMKTNKQSEIKQIMVVNFN